MANAAEPRTFTLGKPTVLQSKVLKLARRPKGVTRWELKEALGRSSRLEHAVRRAALRIGAKVQVIHDPDAEFALEAVRYVVKAA